MSDPTTMERDGKTWYRFEPGRVLADEPQHVTFCDMEGASLPFLSYTSTWGPILGTIPVVYLPVIAALAKIGDDSFSIVSDALSSLPVLQPVLTRHEPVQPRKDA